MSDVQSDGSISKVATTGALVAAIAASLPAVGVLGIQIGLLPPMVGFGLFTAGAALGGLLALLLGIVGTVLTRGGDDPEGRKRAFTALAGGVALLGIVAIAGSSGADLPPINDITTNLDDPPAFAPAPAGHRNADRDMGYPPDWKPLVRDAYPDLTPIRVAVSPQQAYDIAVAEAEALGWEITRRDGTTFEAQATTALFRFVDDVSVRIAADASGQAVIDIRSKSRDGRGDLGANAARIRVFSARVLTRIEGA